MKQMETKETKSKSYIKSTYLSKKSYKYEYKNFHNKRIEFDYNLVSKEYEPPISSLEKNISDKDNSTKHMFNTTCLSECINWELTLEKHVFTTKSALNKKESNSSQLKTSSSFRKESCNTTLNSSELVTCITKSTFLSNKTILSDSSNSYISLIKNDSNLFKQNFNHFPKSGNYTAFSNPKLPFTVDNLYNSYFEKCHNFTLIHNINNSLSLSKLKEFESNSYFNLKINGNLSCQENSPSVLNKPFSSKIDSNLLVSSAYSVFLELFATITTSFLQENKLENTQNLEFYTYTTKFLNDNKCRNIILTIPNQRKVALVLSLEKLTNMALKSERSSESASTGTEKSSEELNKRNKYLQCISDHIELFIQRRAENLVIVNKSFVLKFLNSNNQISYNIRNLLDEVEIISIITEITISNIDNNTSNTYNNINSITNNNTNNDSLTSLSKTDGQTTSVLQKSLHKNDFILNNSKNYSNKDHNENTISLKELSQSIKKNFSNFDETNTKSNYKTEYIPLSERKSSYSKYETKLNPVLPKDQVNRGNLALTTYKTYCNYTIMKYFLTPVIIKNYNNKSNNSNFDVQMIPKLYEKASFNGIDVNILLGEISSKCKL
jgi:hypothetical protein